MVSHWKRVCVFQLTKPQFPSRRVAFYHVWKSSNASVFNPIQNDTNIANNNNFRTLGDYGYTPFPNKHNAEFFYTAQAINKQVKEKTAAFGVNRPFLLSYQVGWYQVMLFFQIASTTLHESPFRWKQRAMKAATLCFEALQRRLDGKRTKLTDDYAVLHAANDTRLPLTMIFCIDSKTCLQFVILIHECKMNFYVLV